MTKKFYIFFLLIIISYSCSCSNNAEIIKIGHIGEFDSDIWNQINKEIEQDNCKLDIVYFNDYELLNKALNDGDIDLNAFQNYIYFVNETNEHNYKLSILERTFVAPMHIYSKNFTNINQIHSNSKIAIPIDKVNLSRSLQILEEAGLIKLERHNNNFYSLSNISENNLNLEIIPMEASVIYYNLDKIDAAIVNYRFIADYHNYNIIYYDDVTKYSPQGQKSYVNLIVCREKDKSYNIYNFIAVSYKQKIKSKIEENKLKGLIVID
ncbi:MetQ/NlpA family ABC transporter substrate-binding protein [Brachyspira murdochii]|uniref:MetQ/NlpA family ABC transporter substrate-binding protein n=1 Tax=Brachyspira murdochii TaxID=84378 RepID=UPI00300571EE